MRALIHLVGVIAVASSHLCFVCVERSAFRFSWKTRAFFSSIEPFATSGFLQILFSLFLDQYGSVRLCVRFECYSVAVVAWKPLAVGFRRKAATSLIVIIADSVLYERDYIIASMPRG